MLVQLDEVCHLNRLNLITFCVTMSYKPNMFQTLETRKGEGYLDNLQEGRAHGRPQQCGNTHSLPMMGLEVTRTAV